MKLTVKVEGLRELDRALGELPKATGRNVLKRALMKAGGPMAEHARRLAPFDEGDLRKSIAVSPKLGTKAGTSEFAAAMQAGLGKDAAVRAMRDARRAAAGSQSFAEVYVGAGRNPQAHLQEFGTVHHAAQPFLRPAFESEKRGALVIFKVELEQEIAKAAKRLARKAARLAAKAAAA